jgi:hypothetical protein
MKKLLLSTIAAAGLVLVSATGASAAPGGMPAAHGTDGKGFGAAVSHLAKTNPMALVAHVSGR